MNFTTFIRAKRTANDPTWNKSDLSYERRQKCDHPCQCLITLGSGGAGVEVYLAAYTNRNKIRTCVCAASDEEEEADGKQTETMRV